MDAAADERQIGFPTCELPSTLREMALSVAASLRVPVTLPAACALGIVSAAIGRGLRLRSGPGQISYGNLYVCAAAESGAGKSQTFGHVARPFLEAESEMRERWELEIRPSLLAEKEILESEVKGLMKKAIQENCDRDDIKRRLSAKHLELAKVVDELAGVHLSTEDCTTQQLAILLKNNRECLTSISPDAGEIINNLLGRFNKLDRTDEGLYLKAFTGEPFKVDRVSRSAVFLKSPLMTCLWLTQPDKVRTLFARQSLSEGGLLPRFLVCDTKAQPQHIVENSPAIDAEIASQYGATVRGLLNQYRLLDAHHLIEPDEAARHLFIEYYNRIVDRRLSDLSDVSGFAARWAEQAFRISVVLHAGLHGARAHNHSLSQETARSAVAIASWFADQQLHILGSSRNKATSDKRAKVIALAIATPGGITARHVQRKRIVETAEEGHTLLAGMAVDGTLLEQTVPSPGGGPTSLVYRLQGA
jgi:hypothetical protein